MITKLVSSLDYQRTLKQFTSLDNLVTDEVIKEHKMNDRDFMNLAKKGEEALTHYLKILKLKANVTQGTKLLIDQVIAKKGYNSNSTQAIMDHEVSDLSNPFDFQMHTEGKYLFYIPSNSIDMLCATILLKNCTVDSTNKTTKGVEERIFVFHNNKLLGIATIYHNLKKPAWAFTETYSQPVDDNFVPQWLTDKKLINPKMEKINGASQFYSLLKPKEASKFGDFSYKVQQRISEVC